MSKNTMLVQKRRGARRRSKVMLLLKLALSFAFVATAAMLSAGIVRVVERPVAPWKSQEQVQAVSQAPRAADVDLVAQVEDAESFTNATTLEPTELEQMPQGIRETRIDDLAEAAPSR